VFAMLHVTDAISIPDSELGWSYARSSGPGGQNVNKVASKAILRWNLEVSSSVPQSVKDRLRRAHPAHLTAEGEFLVTSERFRDQGRNGEACLLSLAGMIRRASTPPKPRKSTRPTRASKKRRLADKQHRSEQKARRRFAPGE